MKNKKGNKTRGIGLFLFVIGITLFSLCFVSGAGFGSSYLPKVDGELQLEVPIGSDVSYFIYPQNQEDKILIVKINITDEDNALKNELKEYYEIPANTSSDEYKIELVFHLANDTGLVGKKSLFKFEVFSTFKTNESSSIVTFSPLGFSKSFYVIGRLPEVVIPPVETPAVTQPVLTGGSGDGGIKKNITKTQIDNTIKEVADNPKEEATKEQETNNTITNTITEIVKEHKVFGIIAIILIAFVLTGGIVFVIRKMTEDY